MKVRIHVDCLCVSGMDERTVRRALAQLGDELAARMPACDWQAAHVPRLQLKLQGNSSAQLTRALADALLRSASCATL